MGDSTNPLFPMPTTYGLVMSYTRRSALTLIAILLFALLFNALFPIALYISALFEPDIMGHPDCDTMNDWLIYVLPVLRNTAYDLGTRICLHYPYS